MNGVLLEKVFVSIRNAFDCCGCHVHDDRPHQIVLEEICLNSLKNQTGLCGWSGVREFGLDDNTPLPGINAVFTNMAVVDRGHISWLTTKVSRPAWRGWLNRLVSDFLKGT